MGEVDCALAQAREEKSYEERVVGQIQFFLRSLSPHPRKLRLPFPLPQGERERVMSVTYFQEETTWI